MGNGLKPDRFVPFVLMHEFEALLFADINKFAHYAGRPDLALKLNPIRERFASPEEINDSPYTAPSKRLLAEFPGYNKPIHGNVAILEIGLAKIRVVCPIFDEWVTRLERYP